MKGIGIEIEFTGVDRERVAHALANYFGEEAIIKQSTVEDAYNYYKIHGWLVKRDRSIIAQMYDEAGEIVDADTTYMCELVSPVLNTDTITDLFKILAILHSLGAFVNKSCGIHVHVDAPDNLSDIVILFKKYLIEQDKLFEEFGVDIKRQGKYCKKYRNRDFYLGLGESHDFDSFLNVLCRMEEGDEKAEKELKCIRYYGMNLYSILQHNTIEFRLFDSSLNEDIILRIIDWVLHFAYSLRDYEGYVKVLSSRLALINLSQG